MGNEQSVFNHIALTNCIRNGIEKYYESFYGEEYDNSLFVRVLSLIRGHGSEGKQRAERAINFINEVNKLTSLQINPKNALAIGCAIFSSKGGTLKQMVTEVIFDYEIACRNMNKPDLRIFKGGELEAYMKEVGYSYSQFNDKLMKDPEEPDKDVMVIKDTLRIVAEKLIEDTHELKIFYENNLSITHLLNGTPPPINKSSVEISEIKGPGKPPEYKK